MAGLAKLCKLYGSMKINNVLWVWDYVNDKPRIKSEMTKQEIEANEKAKWNNLKEK